MLVSIYPTERKNQINLALTTGMDIIQRINELSQPLTGIRSGKTTNSRDNDTKSTNIRYKLNQSQHLSGKGSYRSQPKSGNDIPSDENHSP